MKRNLCNVARHDKLCISSPGLTLQNEVANAEALQGLDSSFRVWVGWTVAFDIRREYIWFSVLHIVIGLN